jgi:hypothetical protein
VSIEVTDRTLFPFEYFEGRISLDDIAQLKGLGIRHVFASLISGRCGSTFFASLCRNAGFGQGEEPFIEQPYEGYQDYTTQEVRRYFDRSVVEGAVGDRYYFQISPQRYLALKHLFVETGLSQFISRFSMILRRNIVAQALSYAVAARSGIWHRYAELSDLSGDGVVITDLEIAEWIAHVYNLELQCFSICRAQEQTLVLFYEDIIASPMESLALFVEDHGYSLPAHVSLDEFSASATLRNPPNFTRYAAFMRSYPFFNQVLAGRMKGGIPSLGVTEAVGRVRAMVSGLRAA